VLADGEAENIGRTGQREAVNSHVVGDVVLFLQNEVLELVGVEDFPGLCTSCQPTSTEYMTIRYCCTHCCYRRQTASMRRNLQLGQQQKEPIPSSE
jgi:hypothetical protein